MIIAVKEPGKVLEIKEKSEEELLELIKEFSDGEYTIYLNPPSTEHTLELIMGDTCLIDDSRYNFEFMRPLAQRYRECLGIEEASFTQEVCGRAIFVVYDIDEEWTKQYRDLEIRDLEAIAYLLRTGSMERTIAVRDKEAIKLKDYIK